MWEKLSLKVYENDCVDLKLFNGKQIKQGYLHSAFVICKKTWKKAKTVWSASTQFNTLFLIEKEDVLNVIGLILQKQIDNNSNCFT